MPLSLAELRYRAAALAHEYAATASERAESQSFWRDFLDVFGQNRRRVAQFEVPVKKADGGQGFIDMFIPGKLIVEQKTLGRDLTKATAPDDLANANAAGLMAALHVAAAYAITSHE